MVVRSPFRHAPAPRSVRWAVLLAAAGLHERVYFRPPPEDVPPDSADGPGPGSAVRRGATSDATLRPMAAVTTAELLQRERLKLSQRVVIHIASQGRLYDDEVATPAFTQAGMAAALRVGQSPLSNILRRLVLGGVLVQDVRHVRGRPKRLRVYRLTAMGEALAVELRRRERPHDLGPARTHGVEPGL